MSRGNVSRLIIVTVLLVLTAGMLSSAPALANDKTNRLLAGLAAGVIIGAALSDDHGASRCYGGYYGPPPPYRYEPPRSHYPGPRQSYNRGYRDGFADGTDYGRHQGYNWGYRNGYSQGRSYQWYADTYGYGGYAPPAGYRPPPPVCW